MLYLFLFFYFKPICAFKGYSSIVWHMELCSMLCASLDGRGVWGRMDTCICMAESFWCSPKTITTLLISYKVKVAQSCPTLCDPMDCSPPGSSVHEIFQARILEWTAISFFRGSSPAWVSCSAGGFFTDWVMREALTVVISSHLSLLYWTARATGIEVVLLSLAPFRMPSM